MPRRSPASTGSAPRLSTFGVSGAFRSSTAGWSGPARTFVSPDIAVCDDCVAELWDPADRRFRYPFVNCTDCGPRFTITLRLPYDRPNTTMAGFPHVRRLRAAEYEDPATVASTPSRSPARFAGLAYGSNRRAGHPDRPPLARGPGCPEPRRHPGGQRHSVGTTWRVTPPRRTAVAELRRRKRRPAKPFAVMVADVAAAERLGVRRSGRGRLADRARNGLSSCSGGGRTGPSPAWWRREILTSGCSCRTRPLHHLCSRPFPGSQAPVPGALVMTSGNLSEEPICSTTRMLGPGLGQSLTAGWCTTVRSTCLRRLGGPVR